MGVTCMVSISLLWEDVQVENGSTVALQFKAEVQEDMFSRQVVDKKDENSENKRIALYSAILIKDSVDTDPNY